MKTRNGFVSNSSSECFICNTNMSVEKTEEMLKRTLYLYNYIFDSNYAFDAVFEVPRKSTKEDRDLLNSYEYNGETKNKMLIYSVEDNSIPYELFEIIESKFGANRIHLG